LFEDGPVVEQSVSFEKRMATEIESLDVYDFITPLDHDLSSSSSRGSSLVALLLQGQK